MLWRLFHTFYHSIAGWICITRTSRGGVADAAMLLRVPYTCRLKCRSVSSCLLGSKQAHSMAYNRRYSKACCILSMLGGFPCGSRKSHRWSHAAGTVPSFTPWSRILVRNRARHLSSISSISRPPYSLLCCRVERGTRNIVSFQMNHTIAVASCLTCSLETEKICAMYYILANKYTCAYLMRWVWHKSRPYTNFAIASTCPVTLVQLLLPDWPTVLENWKHMMVISVQYGMFIMFTVVFQEPVAISFDFRVFKYAPVAFS